jgi:hypothetical protein
MHGNVKFVSVFVFVFAFGPKINFGAYTNVVHDSLFCGGRVR